jgi:hypothetical protein
MYPKSIDMDSGRIRRDLGYAEAVGSRDALEGLIPRKCVIAVMNEIGNS